MNTVLVVDDDKILGVMVKEILEFNNYEAIITKDPQTIKEQILNNEIQLILLDKYISGIDGTEVCASLKSDKKVQHIPILMMSALHEAETECIAAGAAGFIAKPFELEPFLNKVESLIKEDHSVA
ncbi:PleD family two-component system response regulator [Aquimarina sp. W85]|uniref:response regulator n=1 Tax=Aquimarina rhodophyticola TaxID=3342246 RepID=UPI00366FAF73